MALAVASSCLFPSRHISSAFCFRLSRKDIKLQRSAAIATDAAEVMVPSSLKTLHLYEARFLALLEEALRKCDKLIVHVVVENTGRSSTEYAMKYACLSHIQNVRRLNVGALVTIRGVGRVRIMSVSQIEPFMKAMVVPLKDEVYKDTGIDTSSLRVLRKALVEVQELQLKLKTSGSGKMQTALAGALQWAEASEFPDKMNYFVPKFEERVSFAALQPITGATPGELQMLLQQRLSAMEYMDTQQRLLSSIKYAQESRSSIAAKLAIQALQL